MGKEKKIGIKFILNKRLKPIVFEGEDYFPVYCVVVYNRMSNQISFTPTYKFGYLTEKEFHSFVEERTDANIRSELEDFERTIEAIIRFEHRIQADNFRLTGLKDKISSYRQNMLRALEIALNRLLLKHHPLDGIDPERLTFGELYHIIEAKDPEIRQRINGPLEAQIEAFLSLLSFLHTQEGSAPVLLDWLDPAFQAKYRNTIFNVDPINDPVYQRDPVFRKIKHAFPVQISRIPSYLSILDKMIFQAA